MKIDLYILAFSAVTVIATIFVGFWSARKSKTASDFFVAGRSVSVGWNASAISGEYLSAASFMGIAGMVMSSGYDALWYPVCYACGYLFLLLFIAGPLRRFGAYTIPDFAEGRFDSPVFRKIAVVFVLFIGFFYTMPQMKGAGTTLAYIFPGLPYWAGVVLVGAVITLNVALGGMKGITLVQAFQYWAKMFAISVPIFVLMAVYGHYGKQVAENGKLQSTNSFQNIYSVGPTNSPTPLWKLRAASLLGRQRMRSWGIHLGSAGAGGGPAGSLKVRSLLRFYGMARQMNIDAALEYWALEESVLYPTNVVIGTEFLSLVEAKLKSKGIILVEETRTTLKFAPTNSLVVLPRPLMPAKAPADVTWLNPFGPLTTKAAKNAATAIGKQAEKKLSREGGYGIDGPT
jgi:Na+(H+)/acetate symporter ActP